ncbi:MAG: hypothetical protein GTN62_07015 [Gemmatimonadales bacterium]|nr:hypothetical protein [Gemmatimonadales bacterium]NIN11250.1 hypothetical protein [Gemmatimonadales bacterium]NIN49849.1 hypothetical protein [Gemmatimonadales bacterium]NIP07313.1 hypothetical protein [Gemmatimonadales bacterium]NIR03008.1 hypothetical protein [Gemmatimonadales bacterium]
MTGMDFISFLILLVVSVVVSAIMHFGLRYYVIPGLASYCSKVVIGWLGAWLGSPVLGHWFGGLRYAPEGQGYQLYFIPAILGSLALVVLAVDVVKTVGWIWKGEQAPASASGGAGPANP